MGCVWPSCGLPPPPKFTYSAFSYSPEGGSDLLPDKSHSTARLRGEDTGTGQEGPGTHAPARVCAPGHDRGLGLVLEAPRPPPHQSSLRGNGGGVSPRRSSHPTCSHHLSSPWAMVELLGAKLRPGTALRPLSPGREVWQVRRAGGSASGAAPPLPQEPVGSNFAFALHFYVPSQLQLESPKLLQHSFGLRR